MMHLERSQSVNSENIYKADHKTLSDEARNFTLKNLTGRDGITISTI